ncbi:hypothetical protein GGG16DRAFT_119926 [Schizophyllum commune]
MLDEGPLEELQVAIEQMEQRVSSVFVDDVHGSHDRTALICDASNRQTFQWLLEALYGDESPVATEIPADLESIFTANEALQQKTSEAVSSLRFKPECFTGELYQQMSDTFRRISNHFAETKDRLVRLSSIDKKTGKELKSTTPLPSVFPSVPSAPARKERTQSAGEAKGSAHLKRKAADAPSAAKPSERKRDRS